MDALSDTLKDIRPAPEPAPVSPKNVVKVHKQRLNITIDNVDVYLEVDWLLVVSVICSGEGGGGGKAA